MSHALNLRPSPIAGKWYEADPQRLAARIDAWLDAASLPPLDGEVVGVMTPHAGHIYSGAVAAHAFAAVRGHAPRLVALLGPMHHPYFEPLLTSGHEAYQTPLGAVPIDRSAVRALDAALRARLGFGLTSVENDPEHSLEIQLPFLQRALSGKFSLLPIMVRAQDVTVSQALGAALADILSEQDALLVASTDLSHYYPQPQAEHLDTALLDAVAAFDPLAVFDVAQRRAGEACGLGALTAVMWAAQGLGASQARLLRYATSGDVTGDYSAVVGYGAAAFLR